MWWDVLDCLMTSACTGRELPEGEVGTALFYMPTFSSLMAIDEQISLPLVIVNVYEWNPFLHFCPGSSLLWPYTDIYRHRPKISIDSFSDVFMTVMAVD